MAGRCTARGGQEASNFQAALLHRYGEVDVLSLESALYVRIQDTALHPVSGLLQQGFRSDMAYRVLDFCTIDADSQSYVLLSAGAHARSYVHMSDLCAVAQAPQLTLHVVPLSELRADSRLPLSLMPFCASPSYFLSPQALGAQSVAMSACSEIATVLETV